MKYGRTRCEAMARDAEYFAGRAINIELPLAMRLARTKKAKAEAFSYWANQYVHWISVARDWRTPLSSKPEPVEVKT